MKKNIWFLIALIMVGMTACQNERLTEEEVTDLAVEEQENLKAKADAELLIYGEPIPGRLIIEVSDDLLDEVKISERGEIALNSVPSRMSVAFDKLSATHVERVFPIDPRYEGRKRRMGMHRYFYVDIDENINMADAMRTMKEVPGVLHVEYEPVMEMLTDSQPSFELMDYQFRSGDMPFNDPRLRDQWHYNNYSQRGGYLMGADINLFKAWEITTGNPEVIVCVVDGGIAVNHEDLKDNIWTNWAEFYGQPGVDDDGNGFIDDIHGYNFANRQGELIPDDDYHGTHVAGTVAARNNNQIGVAGVAGGDGTVGTGVKLMSANVFGKGRDMGGFATAITYGADNGALISQNSWGSTVPGPTSEAYMKAIDYFRKYAGCDDEGNQLPNSLMKGGVVIVASGNNNSEARYAPGEYGPAIAVNAMDPAYRKASYSNYGTWTDITAPGGDQSRFGNAGGVLSTVGSYTGYEYYNGTSMACPHVSGVAALAISVHGGPGFTALELEEILMAAVLPVDIDEMNPKYAGKLGAGYIDAYAAVTIRNQHKNPESPRMLPEKSKDDEFDKITIYWEVPNDEDDGAPSKYRLYYSDKELNADNYRSGRLAGNAKGYVSGKGLQAGEEMTYEIKNLKHSTTYYFAVVAVDRWGLTSEPAFMSAKTKYNNPAEITNIPAEPILLLDVLGTAKYRLNVVEPDGQKWTHKMSGDTRGVSLRADESGIDVTIRNILGAGSYTFTITLTDELGSTSSFDIPFQIVEVVSPVVSTPIPDLILGIDNDPIVIDLNNHFAPQEFLKLKFSATSNDGTAVSASLDDSGKLTLKGYKYGQTTINVNANNGYKETNTFFTVTVTQDSNRDVYSVWPLPFKNELNLWLNPNVKNAKVTMHSLRGELVLEKTVSSDVTGISKINTKGIAPGTYRLKIDAGSQPYERVIHKR